MAKKKFSRLSVLLEAKDRMSGAFQKAAVTADKLKENVKKLSSSLDKSKNSTSSASRSTKELADKYKEIATRLGQVDEKVKKTTQIFNSLPKPIKLAALAAKQFGNAIIDAAKSTNTYTGIQMKITGVKKSLQAAYLAHKLFNTSATGMLKNTKAWIGLEMSVNKTKKSIQSGYLAFNLWKNVSPTVEKISNKFKSLGNFIGKLVNPLRQTSNEFKNINNKIGETGNRGRATFNQLADSNAKLNKQLAKMNSELSKANSKLGSMKSNMGSMNAMGTAFGVAYAGQAAFGAGQQVVKGTVGTAMDQQYSQASVGILAGAENGAKFYKQIQEYAASTAYSSEDWAKNMRGAIGHSKTIKDLQVYQTAIEQLATLDPAQGLEGAALAVRELNSGDPTSLVERFELPRSALKGIKDMKDPVKQLEAMSKIVGDSTGYTVKNIKEMKKLPLMQWQKLTNSVKTAFGYMGAGALKVLAPMIQKFNKLWDSGAFKGFIDSASKGFADVTTSVVDFGKKMFSSLKSDGVKSKMQPFIDLFNNIKSSVSEAWPTIKPIFENLGSIASQTAGMINKAWPQVNSLLQTALKLVKDISTWVANNWPTLAPIIAGVVTAMLTFSTLSTVVTLWRDFRVAVIAAQGALTLATAAQWALDAAMAANPIGLVALAIGALVAAGILLWQNWDAVKAKCIELWDKFGMLMPMMGSLLGPFGSLIAAGVGLIANWDSLKDKATSIWDSIVSAFTGGVNGAIGAINTLTSAINMIPGVNIGSIPKLASYNKYANTKVSSAAKQPKLPQNGGGKGLAAFGIGHHGGLDRVPYDGYPARLHKGEKVLTRNEVKNSERSGVTVTGNTFVVRQESDIDAIADALYSKLSGAQTQMG